MTGDIFVRAARWIVPAYALLSLTLVDRINPGAEPKFDLTGVVALVAWVFAESGQTLGVTAIATTLLIILVTRGGLSRRSRAIELAVMIVVSVVVLYGGKLLNDHVVKPAIGTPRPNVIELSELDLLGMDVDRFYDLSQQRRSEHLDGLKSTTGFGTLFMRPEVRDHWVKETAFARPSGHSLASLTFATFYLSVALTSLTGWRQWPFFLLVPWAVGVCFSRAILRVHWPADIAIGALVGIMLGAGAFVVSQWVVRRLQSRSRH